mgnify:CR=1 FL=1
MIKTKSLLKGALVAGAICVLPGMASAAMTGQCSVCHTMHDSQDGVSVTGQAQPNAQLLIGDGCAGCHDVDANDATGRGSFNAPQVGSGTSASLNAGGYFSGTAVNQHDVSDLSAAADGNLGNVPPGGTDLGTQLTCAGTSGCHTSGGHHANTGNDSATWLTGASVGGSFRFLDGVQGIEDDDFENEAATDHNTYYGATSGNPVAGTMSNLCASCHTDFHSTANTQSGAGWIRHPTDLAMSATYVGNYDTNSGGAASYNAAVPVATSTAGDNTIANNGTTDAIVMCLSCHRAHGSDQADLLRFDYSLNLAGPNGASPGCETCHGAK